ncbi:MAG: glycosyltransferase family 39 protein [Chitinophagaceae bacterium]|nr:glycosyltransferase family 39 protein [Chitinophagaceae bacterium]
MTSWIRTHHRVLFYGVWMLLAFAQAAFTELRDDEAYYYFYGLYPDWGYFDHPPLTGWLVRAGNLLLPGNLGVRLFFLLLHFLTLLLLERLTGKKDPLLFYATLLSLAIVQVAGFWAAPDTVLLFGTALFLWFYERYNARPGWSNACLLALGAGILLYSKYHGVLVIFFVGMSRLSLLRRKEIWAAGLLTWLLYCPHLYWQYQHHWVSFRYHLFESNVNPYQFSFTLSYLAGQILLAGPFAAFVLLPAAFRQQKDTALRKAAFMVMTGTWIFFLLSSFRGKVELNWTVHTLVPVILLSHAYLSEKRNNRRWLIRLMWGTLPFIIGARLLMGADLLSLKAVKKNLHAWNGWPEKMKDKTGGLPVVFNSSYQFASKYGYHTGLPFYSLSEYKSRRSQFNYTPAEETLLGKPVLFMDSHNWKGYAQKVPGSVIPLGYRVDSFFVSFPRLQLLPAAYSGEIRPGDSLRLTARITIPDAYRTFLDKEKREIRDTLRIAFYEGLKWKKDIITGIRVRDLLQRDSLQLVLDPALPAGRYKWMAALNAGHYAPTHNSEKYPLLIY